MVTVFTVVEVIGLIFIGLAFWGIAEVRKHFSMWLSTLRSGVVIRIEDKVGAEKKTFSDYEEAATYMKPLIRTMANRTIIFATLGFVLLWGSVITDVLIGTSKFSIIVWSLMILLTLAFAFFAVQMVFYRDRIWGDKI